MGHNVGLRSILTLKYTFVIPYPVDPVNPVKLHLCALCVLCGVNFRP
jgi:hypothetical protein